MKLGFVTSDEALFCLQRTWDSPSYRVTQRNVIVLKTTLSTVSQ